MKPLPTFALLLLGACCTGNALAQSSVNEHHPLARGGRVELLDSPEVARGGHGAMVRITLPRQTEAEGAGVVSAAVPA